MGAFDQFVAELQCPHCGAVERAGMQTKLRCDAANLAQFRTGDHFQFELSDAADWGYLVVQTPAQPVRFGQMWECARCKYHPNWADVAIDGDRIASIEAVALNASELARLHFLEEDAAPFIAEAVDADATRDWDYLVPRLRAWLVEDPARELYPDGFEVTVAGRKLRVIPIPKKP